MALQELFSRDAGAVWGWPALLLAAALLSSFTFACVTPFAAFAVLTALTMGLKRALGAVAAIWAVNQALGFLALGYPLDASTVAWGGAIGVAALAATLAAKAFVGSPSLPEIVAGFAAAFVAYEAVLVLASLFLGGTANFALAIDAKLALSDACWLAGIAILRHLLARMGAFRAAGSHTVTT